MNTKIVALATTAALGALLLTVVPAASAGAVSCTSGAATDIAGLTYGKLVYENLMWPNDAVKHATDYAFHPSYGPSFDDRVTACTGPAVSCSSGAAMDIAGLTYGKVVYENLMWPNDAVKHANDYAFHPSYAPSFDDRVAACL